MRALANVIQKVYKISPLLADFYPPPSIIPEIVSVWIGAASVHVDPNGIKGVSFDFFVSVFMKPFFASAGTDNALLKAVDADNMGLPAIAAARPHSVTVGVFAGWADSYKLPKALTADTFGFEHRIASWFDGFAAQNDNEVIMLLGSKRHTANDTTRWRVDYTRWLDNTAVLEEAVVTSSSSTCTVNNEVIVGREVVFYLTGGVVGETLIVSIAITDSLENVKNDTIAYTVVAA